MPFVIARPVSPSVVSLEDVRLEIVESMTIDRDISAAGIEVRRIDQTRQWLHSGMLGVTRAQVAPSSVVTWTQPIVRARPEHSFFQRRFGERKNRVVIFDAGDVDSESDRRSVFVCSCRCA